MPVPLLRQLLDQLWQERKAQSSQIETISQQIKGIAELGAVCERLQQIPGVGSLIATAMVAAVGNGSAFVKGRDFPAWLSLVPRQHSSGGESIVAGDQQARQSVSEAPEARKSYPDGIFATALKTNPERFKIDDAKISKLLSKRSQAG